MKKATFTLTLLLAVFSFLPLVAQNDTTRIDEIEVFSDTTSIDSTSAVVIPPSPLDDDFDFPGFDDDFFSDSHSLHNVLQDSVGGMIFVLAVLFIIFVAIYALKPDGGVRPNWQLIALTPLMLIQLGVLGLGFGIIISALTTKYRDLSMLVAFGVHLWMYATPVTYSASMIADKYPQLLGLYMLNPITPIIELFRAAYLGVPRYSYGYNLLSVIVTVAVFMLGVILFSRTEKTFMDTV